MQVALRLVSRRGFAFGRALLKKKGATGLLARRSDSEPVNHYA